MVKRKKREKKELRANKNPCAIATIILAIALVLVLAFAFSSINKNSNNKNNNEQVIENNNQQESNEQRVDVSLDDDPIKGQDNAPVVIVEFGDFQCPFCERFFSQTLPLIKENYIKTGKVKFVYRDFPLTSIHQYAEKAAEAADCANEQGKFWEYHDLLFSRQYEWASVGVEKFKEYASELGLDTTKFNECLDSGKYENEVRKDFNDGLSYGVRGTPTFFINGIEVVGAQPYSVFQQVIEKELEKKS